jgi:hypothetical protein
MCKLDAVMTDNDGLSPTKDAGHGT